ncbi:MAG: macro domain-containing protein [Firmicutes bacterium]|nr:macro domain-containing protein [Bacillota bacterium]
MISYTKGNILKAETEALVNTVNCVGIMGRGIALKFKQAFPDNYEIYASACRRKGVQPGRMFVFETGRICPRYVINFPTKRHWRGKSRIEDIEEGLADLVKVIKQYGIKSVAIPPLGSGLGGLNWNDVRPRIDRALAPLSQVDVLIFEPFAEDGAIRYNNSTDVPQMTAGRAALIGLMDQYLSALLDPMITLLEVHKLMYLLQAVGEPLRLRFIKASHGPYAENLRHVLRTIDGHYISGYAGCKDVPGRQLSLLPGSVKDTEIFLGKHPATRKRVGKVSRLVDGFETPSGLELLSTVHWLIANEGVSDEDNLVQAVHEWIPGKRRFTSTQITLTRERLQAEGWLN